MNKLSVRDIEVSGKRILVRVDFNVPLDESTGKITDDSRILAALPTIRYLIEHSARVVLASHLGRPDGKVVESMRLTVVAERLSQLLARPVATIRDCIGREAEAASAALKNGDVLLLENLRFHAAEEKNEPAFAQALSRLADIYVDDAFGTAHRSHASIVGVTQYLPSVAGLLLEREIETLGGLLDNPAHPFGMLVGGAKVSDKVAMLENVMAKADVFLIGGGMAAIFLKARSCEVGQSLVEKGMTETASDLINKAAANNVRLLMPVDVVVSDEIAPGARGRVVPVESIPVQAKIVDIGPETIEIYRGELARCKMVFWNGPMGIFEIDQFAAGTRAMAETLAGLEADTIIGGGSTGEIVTNLGLADKMSFVSTGGGASLEFLSGESLPGVEALLDKNSRIPGK